MPFGKYISHIYRMYLHKLHLYDTNAKLAPDERTKHAMEELHSAAGSSSSESSSVVTISASDETGKTNGAGQVSLNQNPPRRAGTAYEQMRLDNIERNKELLRKLGLEKGGAAFLATTPLKSAKKAGGSSKRQESGQNEPETSGDTAPRRSLRNKLDFS
jgi:hypothetical protein